jgi:hypothetical protein
MTSLIADFSPPVPPEFPNIRLLQKSIYATASTPFDNSVSATRCAQIFSQSELFSLFLDAYEKVDFVDPSDLSPYGDISTIAAKATALHNYIRIAIGEGKTFLATSLVRVLESFLSKESSLTNLNVALFLILAVNTREP